VHNILTAPDNDVLTHLEAMLPPAVFRRVADWYDTANGAEGLREALVELEEAAAETASAVERLEHALQKAERELQEALS
jgi:hypothetical protein